MRVQYVSVMLRTRITREVLLHLIYKHKCLHSNSISLPNDTNIDIENIRQQFHVNEESDETNPTAQATERIRRMRARWTAEQHAEYNECHRDRCWNIY